MSMTQSALSLEGLTVLIVEDETIVAMLLEDMLEELGCSRVLHAGSIDEAIGLVRERKPDAAMVDVNLGGVYAYPVAASLAEAGVPFVFTTGYGADGIAAEWAARPVVQKPFSMENLSATLKRALSENPASA
jgi:CheY-like chemotaxis protein